MDLGGLDLEEVDKEIKVGEASQSTAAPEKNALATGGDEATA